MYHHDSQSEKGEVSNRKKCMLYQGLHFLPVGKRVEQKGEIYLFPRKISNHEKEIDQLQEVKEQTGLDIFLCLEDYRLYFLQERKVFCIYAKWKEANLCRQVFYGKGVCQVRKRWRKWNKEGYLFRAVEGGWKICLKLHNTPTGTWYADNFSKSFLKWKKNNFSNLHFHWLSTNFSADIWDYQPPLFGLFFVPFYTYASQYDTEVFTLPFVIISIYLYLCAIAKSTRKI